MPIKSGPRGCLANQGEFNAASLGLSNEWVPTRLGGSRCADCATGVCRPVNAGSCVTKRPCQGPPFQDAGLLKVAFFCAGGGGRDAGFTLLSDNVAA